MSLSQQPNILSARHRSKYRGLVQAANAWDKQTGRSGNRLQQKTLNPAIFRLMGSLRGKVIYDIACGNGHLARRLIRAGAKQIWASDLSRPMIAIARNKYKNRNIHYIVKNATNFKGIPRRKFDIVLLNRAIGYVGDAQLLLRGVNQVLKPGGVFIFTLSHPLKPVALKALGKSVNVIDSAERYLKKSIERPSQRVGRLFPMLLYRRPLNYYVNLCGANGLYIQSLLEPKSITAFGRKNRNTPIPMYLIIKVKRRK